MAASFLCLASCKCGAACVRGPKYRNRAAEQSVLSISLSTLFRAQKRLPQFPLNGQAHLQPWHIFAEGIEEVTNDT